LLIPNNYNHKIIFHINNNSYTYIFISKNNWIISYKLYDIK
jgi:hypothetical protein